MPEPLREHLESPTDEARISRMWENVRRRRASRRPSMAPVAAAACLAAAAAAVLFWPRAPLELTLTEGGAPGVLVAAERATEVEFSDGSAVRLAPHSRVETLENDATRFSLLLAEGAARFEVTPGGPRRWRIEGGAATVEVVGTVFEVDRRDGGLRVEVERGVVVVRGERVPDRVVRLTRGQSLTVDAPRVAVAPPPPRSAPLEPAPPPPEVVPAPEPPPRAAAPRPEPAPRPRGRVELAPPSTGVDGLLERAREAEAQGQVHRQAALLRRVSEGDDPRAALAAFTLGRLEMDRLGHPEQARGALRRALALGLPRRLAEQARARLRTLDSGGPPAHAPREIEPPDTMLGAPAVPDPSPK